MTDSQMMSSDGGEYYLYVVLEFPIGKYSHALYRISLFDLILRLRSRTERGRDDRKKLKKLHQPILKLPYNRFPSFMGFFNVGSKIYIFGGDVNSRKRWRKPRFSQSCYVFDTHNNPSNLVKDGPLMTSGKSTPKVLGPLNGKFYVLSYTLASRDLEEFNPQTESWSALPPPPITCEGLEDGDDDYMVISYAIVKNRLFLSTNNKGTYTFDVISHEWEHLSSFGDGNYDGGFPFNEGVEFLDGFWYACVEREPLRAYHFDEYRGFREFPVRGARHPSRLLKDNVTGNVVPLSDRRTLCVVRSGFPRHSSGLQFCVTVDVCELTKFRVNSRGKAKPPEVSTQYSARYIKNDDLGRPMPFGVVTCFVMGPDYDKEFVGRGRDRDRESREHHKRHARCSASPGRLGARSEDGNSQNEPKKKKEEGK